MIATSKIPSLLSGARSPLKQVTTRFKSIGGKARRFGRAGFIQARRMKHSAGMKTRKMLDRPKRYLQDKIKGMAIKPRASKRFSRPLSAKTVRPGSNRKASLIKRYHDITLPKNKANAAKRSAMAANIRAFRKQQASRPAGKQLNARAVIHSNIKRHVHQARAEMAKRRASAIKTFSTSTPHYRAHRTITISPQVRKKSARYAAQKAKSVMAGAGAQGRKPRGRRAELLKTHVNYA